MHSHFHRHYYAIQSGTCNSRSMHLTQTISITCPQMGESQQQEKRCLILYCMNLNIQQIDKLPETLQLPLIFSHLPSLNALLLAPMPAEQEKPNAKKKINFKGGGNTSAAAAVQVAFLFDLEKREWRSVETKGRFPSRRTNPGVVCGENGLMVYGGKETAATGKALNDLYCLGVEETWTWRKLFTMEGPPPCPSPVVCGLGGGGLLVVVGEVWVFDGRGVNWQTDKPDLPGGHWERVGMGSVPFGVAAGCGEGKNVLLFGLKEEGGIAGAVAEVQQGQVRESAVQIEGEFKGDSLMVCTTSAGRGLVLGGETFCSYFSEEDKIYLGDLTSVEQSIEQIALVETQETRCNWAISAKRELLSIEATMEQFQDEVDIQQAYSEALETEKKEEPEDEQEGEEQEENLEQSPDTARHVSVNQAATEPPPLNSPPLTPPMASSSPPELPFLQHLQPLLARETRKRQVLQEKGWLLEGAIKKAEGMVLGLCRYGSQEDKLRHIGRVRQMRSALEEIFKRQMFLRRRRDEHQVGEFEGHLP